MNETNQPPTETSPTDSPKNKLFNLIQEILPEKTLSPETAEFMATGIIPIVWLKELFELDISFKKFGKMHSLMYFIHIDLPEKKKNVQQAKLGDSSTLPIETNPPASTKIPTKHPQKKTPKKATQDQKKETLSEKNGLSESELAEKLFQALINSSLGEESTLGLKKLRATVSQKLIGHTISHNPQNKILTLYDEAGIAVASSCTKGIEIISE
jgi:hypothetical protein